MKKLVITLEDLFNLEGAVIYNPDSYKPLSIVSIDSRNIPSGAVFIAIKGEKFDAHNFLKDAVKNGAKTLIVNEERKEAVAKFNLTVVTVPDTTKALGELASIWRNRLKTKIIALTGSVGKTSTKELLAQLLSVKYKVNKTLANHNNHIGVPLTIFSTNNKFDILVCELGTNHFGEIPYTANIVKPDYAVITNIGSGHLEHFLTKKGILKEKTTLLNITAANKGTIFINNDDKLLKKYGESFKKKVTYGFSTESDIKGRINNFDEMGRPEITITYKRKDYSYKLPVHGYGNAQNFLAAASVAFTLGVTPSELTKGIKKLTAFDKRLSMKSLNGMMLIDDTYNANPDSMISSINLLGSMNIYIRKIAVLGDMFELGDNEIKLHLSLASALKKNKISELYTIGKRMRHLNSSLKESKINVRHFSSEDALKIFLEKKDLTNSLVLVKGSRGMRMEQFVKIIEGKKN